MPFGYGYPWYGYGYGYPWYGYGYGYGYPWRPSTFDFLAMSTFFLLV